MDSWYVKNRSLCLDFVIIGRTVFTVLSRKGVSSVGTVTNSPFKGVIKTNLGKIKSPEVD